MSCSTRREGRAAEMPSNGPQGQSQGAATAAQAPESAEADPRRQCAYANERKGRSRPVSRVLSWTVIPLGAASPRRSSNLPGGTAGRGIASLFGLAPGGVCRAGPLPDSRCALTAPFHPCLISEEPSAVSFCCTFRRLAPPRRYLAPCPVEPGLSSAFSRNDATVRPTPPCAFYGFAFEYPKVCCANFGPRSAPPIPAAVAAPPYQGGWASISVATWPDSAASRRHDWLTRRRRGPCAARR